MTKGLAVLHRQYQQGCVLHIPIACVIDKSELIVPYYPAYKRTSDKSACAFILILAHAPLSDQNLSLIV